MRELSPTHRMKGKDGDAAKKSLRTDSVRITKWEWVEEALDSGNEQGLQFVTESGVARPHGSFRDLIRSKARRKGKTQGDYPKTSRKSSATRSTAATDTDSERSRTTTPISSGVVTPKTALKTPQPLLCQGLERGLVDPFCTLPISESGETRFLIHHYFSIFKPSYAPLLQKEDLFNFAMTDSAALHSLLVHSAFNLRGVGQLKQDHEMLYHQGEAIRLINGRLGDSRDKPASEATIFTVANMTHFEIHMDGLEALVKSRGGIQSLESHPLTRKVVMWTDTVAAVALDAPPRFTLKDLTPCSPLPEPTYCPLAHRYKDKLSNLTTLGSFAEETISIYQSFRALTAVKDAICFSPTTLPDSPSFETKAHTIETLERQCLSIIQSPLLHPYSLSPINSIYLLFGNAALIHMMVFMRESPRRLPFARILSNRIRDCLEGIDLRMFQNNYPDLMMWIYIMGGLGSVGTDNQGWFASMLAEAVRCTGMVELRDLEIICGDWLWTKLYVDVLSEGFWSDFEGAVRGRGMVR